MPLILNPRFALCVFALLTVWGGVALSPRVVGVSVLGAWTGTLLVGPPVAIILLVLRIRTLGETLRPLTQLPVFMIITALILVYAGANQGAIPVFAGGALALWWMKRKLGLLPF